MFHRSPVIVKLAVQCKQHSYTTTSVHISRSSSFFISSVKASTCEAERLVPRTPNLEVQGSSLARRVVSLEKELYSTLSLTRLSSLRFINMDYHPVQGGVSILLGMLHAKETGISFGRLGLWLVCTFTYYL